MVWSYVNQQYYCNRCEIFIQSNAPMTSADNLRGEVDELLGKKKSTYQNPTCIRCERPLSYIPQYKRWYCYNCQQYY